MTQYDVFVIFLLVVTIGSAAINLRTTFDVIDDIGVKPVWYIVVGIVSTLLLLFGQLAFGTLLVDILISGPHRLLRL